MQPRKLSRRTIASAILVLVGATCAAMALLLAPSHFDFDIVFPLFFLGVMLIGAGMLCPFRRTIYGTVAGFLVAVYLTTPVVRVTGNGSETFKNVAAELGVDN